MYYMTKDTAGKLINIYVEGFKECCKKNLLPSITAALHEHSLWSTVHINSHNIRRHLFCLLYIS